MFEMNKYVVPSRSVWALSLSAVMMLGACTSSNTASTPTGDGQTEGSKGLFPVKGNGDRTTQDRPLGAFTQVQNDTSVPVTISQGDQSVSVTVDSNLQSLLLTEVSNGVLKITTNKNIEPTLGSNVKISITGLTGVTLTGSGPVIAGVTPGANLALNLTGSGPLTFNGTAQAVNAQQSGSGPLLLTGSAQSLTANLSGPGFLDAKGLPVSGAAQLISSGSGLLSATANGTVSFDLSGSGNIIWYGSAQVTGQNKTGSGSITHGK
ncbi:head GIN domain-containing protein [Hyalangium versicolor]|uniref:head GIN domain-containing protein n=1 Tax=Hyalangium versicolor TaxID=2861190 RepID=UPI001CCD333F|nr:head GIN domain-containing protein [Hyalangium versicolor]